MDPIVSMLVLLVVIGFVVYLIDRFIPMAEPFKTIFRFIIVIVFCVLLLRVIGVNVPLHLGR